MQTQIIEQLKKMGKVTEEDVRNAMREIPNKFELEIIEKIWNEYSSGFITDNINEEKDMWIDHFLPILRSESEKCREKAEKINKTIYESQQNPVLDQPLPSQPQPKTHL